MNILLLIEPNYEQISSKHLTSNLQALITAAKRINAQAKLTSVMVANSLQLNPELIAYADSADAIIGCNKSVSQASLAMLAAHYDVDMVTGVTNIISPNVFERSTYAKQIVETVEIRKVAPLIFSINEYAFSEFTKIELEVTKIVANNLPFKVINKTSLDTNQPNITTAKTIVAIGGGVSGDDNFNMIEIFAEKMNAVIGASRGAVDNGLVKSDFLIGQSGKKIAADLYIAIGVAGASQHIAGMQDAKTVFAINKDPHAPIFKHANYGLVGDYKKILPELIEVL